jgi:hypothetical protein
MNLGIDDSWVGQIMDARHARSICRAKATRAIAEQLLHLQAIDLAGEILRSGRELGIHRLRLKKLKRSLVAHWPNTKLVSPTFL